MGSNRLTEKACAAAKPSEREVRLFDGLGLYLAIRPSGAKNWKLKYRFGGREKKLTLGPYPLLSLKQAREARDKARMEILAGTDPAAEKRAAKMRARAGETFEQIARSWHEQKKLGLSPRYAEQVLTRLEANIFPAFGRMLIKEITPLMVLEAIRRIEARGANTMAHEVRGHVSEVFVWAMASGLAEMDPAAMIRKALASSGSGRRPALLKIELARDLVAAIDNVKLAATATKLASRLLALTAVRPGVVRLAERTEFEGLDTDQALWRIPATKMKLTKDRKADSAYDFVVPLSKQAVETVTTAMESSQHSSWLFPVDRGTKPISDSTLSQLYLDAGYRGRHVPHGWRATFSTIMNELAAAEGREGDRAIIDLMLAHMPGGVEAAYNRASYMPRRRELAQQWADMLMTKAAPPAQLVKEKRRQA